MVDKVNAYSRLDRLVHKLAFSMPFAQRILADMEDSIFEKQLAQANDRSPIFITSLPRAGTTTLLTALADVPELASHTYRDMPFVMAPLLWSKLSGSFQKEGAMKERAHGDGIQVGIDSPEAFEEILWRNFWPEKFQSFGIDLWSDSDADANAAMFLRKHFAKIVALRCEGNETSGRYISKNNGNMARLDFIPSLFPDAKIVLPIRAPMEHAASLLRQHTNFLERHKRDPFTRRYMNDVGHLEFGDLHRPILFPGFQAATADVSPETLDYWLHYWIAAFDYVAERKSRLIIVPHEHICNESSATVSNLFNVLDISGSYMVDKVSSHFKPIVRHFHEDVDHSENLRVRANELYATLLQLQPA